MIFLVLSQPHLFCTRRPRVLLPYSLLLLHFLNSYVIIYNFNFIEYYNDIYTIYDKVLRKSYHTTEASNLVDCLSKINWDIICNIMPTIQFWIRCTPWISQFIIILVVPLGAKQKVIRIPPKYRQKIGWNDAYNNNQRKCGSISIHQLQWKTISSNSRTAQG